MLITKNLNREFIPRTFSDIIDNFVNNSNTETSEKKFLPNADVVEDDKAYHLAIVLPGVNKEDIKIEVDEKKLTVKAERKLNKEEGKKYHITESAYGVFLRSFYLPEGVNTQAIEASYTNGILNLALPKDEKKTYKATVEVK